MDVDSDNEYSGLNKDELTQEVEIEEDEMEGNNNNKEEEEEENSDDSEGEDEVTKPSVTKYGPPIGKYKKKPFSIHHTTPGPVAGPSTMPLTLQPQPAPARKPSLLL